MVLNFADKDQLNMVGSRFRSIDIDKNGIVSKKEIKVKDL